MECTDYLGFVTSLDHWNRLRSALLKSFRSSKNNLQRSWHGASRTLGISWVTKVSLLFMSPLDHSWVYANEGTHGGTLHSFKIETGHQKDQPLIRRLGLWASPTSREGRWIEFKCMVHDLINETPINLWTAKLSGGSLLVNSCWEDEVPSSHGERAQKLCVQDLPDLALCVSSFGWSDLYPLKL